MNTKIQGNRLSNPGQPPTNKAKQPIKTTQSEKKLTALQQQQHNNKLRPSQSSKQRTKLLDTTLQQVMKEDKRISEKHTELAKNPTKNATAIQKLKEEATQLGAKYDRLKRLQTEYIKLNKEFKQLSEKDQQILQQSQILRKHPTQNAKELRKLSIASGQLEARQKDLLAKQAELSQYKII